MHFLRHVDILAEIEVHLFRRFAVPEPRGIDRRVIRVEGLQFPKGDEQCLLLPFRL